MTRRQSARSCSVPPHTRHLQPHRAPMRVQTEPTADTGRYLSCLQRHQSKARLVIPCDAAQSQDRPWPRRFSALNLRQTIGTDPLKLLWQRFAVRPVRTQRRRRVPVLGRQCKSRRRTSSHQVRGLMASPASRPIVVVRRQVADLGNRGLRPHCHRRQRLGWSDLRTM